MSKSEFTNDPAVLGTSGYERNALDFYPTPDRSVQSLLSVIGDDLPAYYVWEPFCGNGAISRHLEDARGVLNSDIRAYEGFEADFLSNFFNVVTDEEYALLQEASEHAERKMQERNDEDTRKRRDEILAEFSAKIPMSRLSDYKGFIPDAIISNPPYGRDAEKCAAHALKLMETVKGNVIFFCRHDWDTSKRRAALFDHPAFDRKIVLRHRPRWIEGSEGAPRFNYAWYCWSFEKATAYPHAKPEIVYVA